MKGKVKKKRGEEDINEIDNNRCMRKLTGVVDAFLREACDRIETHDQYKVIQIPHIRKEVQRKRNMPSKNAISSCEVYSCLYETY